MYSIEILLSKLANAEQHDIFLAKTFCLTIDQPNKVKPFKADF